MVLWGEMAGLAGVPLAKAAFAVLRDYEKATQEFTTSFLCKPGYHRLKGAAVRDTVD